jgi:hypothetical protein
VCGRLGGNCHAWCGTDSRELYHVYGYRQAPSSPVIHLHLTLASQRRRKAIEADALPKRKSTPDVRN